MSADAAPSNLYEIEGVEHFQSLLSADLARISLINFWAPWADPCKQMNEVVRELAKKYPQILVLQVEAETQSDISESFDIEAVPSFIILRGHTLLDRIAGADAATLTKSIATHVLGPTFAAQSHTTRAPASAPAAPTESPEQLAARLHQLMRKDTVVLFMKGSPDVPRCGFSRRIVALLREQNIPFASFDILSDESVRAGLKEINDWPTFPQLVVKGEFVGGLDIVQEMVENGELKELLA